MRNKAIVIPIYYWAIKSLQHVLVNGKSRAALSICLLTSTGRKTLLRFYFFILVIFHRSCKLLRKGPGKCELGSTLASICIWGLVSQEKNHKKSVSVNPNRLIPSVFRNQSRTVVYQQLFHLKQVLPSTCLGSVCSRADYIYFTIPPNLINKTFVYH